MYHQRNHSIYTNNILEERSRNENVNIHSLNLLDFPFYPFQSIFVTIMLINDTNLSRSDFSGHDGTGSTRNGYKRGKLT